jgi:hypothetical protein
MLIASRLQVEFNYSHRIWKQDSVFDTSELFYEKCDNFKINMLKQ